jgi:DNA-3-methyladenine glycosylase
LPRSFYARGAAVVARQLLGHWLLRREATGWSGGMIVETEAYLAGDPASHGFRGETARNRAMFGPPGRAYVYFIYGNHWCFNAVCRAPGVPEAVLVRALEPIWGVEFLQRRRPVERLRDLTSGPAKLCAALGLDRRQDQADLCAAEAEVWVAGNPARAAAVRRLGGVVVTTRVGLSRAADLPLRFLLPGSRFVSRRPAGLR